MQGFGGLNLLLAFEFPHGFDLGFLFFGYAEVCQRGAFFGAAILLRPGDNAACGEHGEYADGSLYPSILHYVYLLSRR